MILDARQAKIDAVQVPEINRFPGEIKLSPKWISIQQALVKALCERYSGQTFIINDCVSQTLNFLITLGATNELEIEVKKINLWKKWVALEPISEGICIQLKSAMIKHHYTKMHKAMSDGHVYSHWGLTIVKECVLYTLEYLKKNHLLKNDKDLLKRDNVMEWLKIGENKNE